MTNFANQEWMIIAAIFFAVILYIAWIRKRDRTWIENRFGIKNTLAMSFGVGCYGKATDPGKPKRQTGFLLLLPDRLFFRSPGKGTEIDIPGKKIAAVYPGNSHKGVSLHQSVVIVDFVNENGDKDAVAFKVPYPPQWIGAIENAFGVRR